MLFGPASWPLRGPPAREAAFPPWWQGPARTTIPPSSPPMADHLHVGGGHAHTLTGGSSESANIFCAHVRLTTCAPRRARRTARNARCAAFGSARRVARGAWRAARHCSLEAAALMMQSRRCSLDVAASQLQPRGCSREAAASRLQLRRCGLDAAVSKLQLRGCSLEAAASRLQRRGCIITAATSRLQT